MNVPPPGGEAAAPPTAWARRAGAAGGGYEAIQGTRPQTIGYLLDDSPAGLAAWLIEKFPEWADTRRPAGPHHGPAADQRDGLLAEPHRRVVRPALLGAPPGPGDDGAPATGHRADRGGQLPRRTRRSLRPHAERYFNVVHWAELPSGGHFPAMEAPRLFVADVRAFFRQLRP